MTISVVLGVAFVGNRVPLSADLRPPPKLNMLVNRSMDPRLWSKSTAVQKCVSICTQDYSSTNTHSRVLRKRLEMSLMILKSHGVHEDLFKDLLLGLVLLPTVVWQFLVLSVLP